MNSIIKYRYSFVAGAFAASGSFFGKLSGHLSSQQLSELLPMFEINYYIEFALLRVLPIILMVLCNLLNWRYFLRALRTAEETLSVTVLITAANYIISFFLGATFFSEPYSFLSLLGTVIIVFGLFLMNSEDHHGSNILFNKNK